MVEQAIWVIAEQTRGKLAQVSLEVLGEARRLASAAGGIRVGAVLLGNNIVSVAETLLGFGADIVHVIDHPRLELYQNDTYAAVLRKLVLREQPGAVLWGATLTGEELAPTLAAQLQTGLAAHCTSLDLRADGSLTMVVPAFGGQVLGEIFCPGARPQMASIKPGVFGLPKLSAAAGKVMLEDGSALLADVDFRLRAMKLVREEPAGQPIEGAEVVVAGGWGMLSRENWLLLEELAMELNGAVGCTRPALDAGWTAGEHTMIGTSGKTVRPKVYLGFGLSGATHHLVGVKDSGVIVSVNKDTKAPVFAYSDYFAAADCQAILPALLEEIRRAKK